MTPATLLLVLLVFTPGLPWWGATAFAISAALSHAAQSFEPSAEDD